MKRGSSFFCLSLLRAVFIISMSLGIMSCDMWNKDLLGYLEYWSETVQVGKVEVTGATTQKNDAGVDTISLTATPTITGYIINPKDYELNREVGPDSSSDKSVRISGGLESLVAVTGDNTMMSVRLADASQKASEHTSFTVSFVPVRTDTGMETPSRMSVTLQYNTPPVAPTRMKKADDGSLQVVLEGETWEADADDYLYWRWNYTTGGSTADQNDIQWFSIDGQRYEPSQCQDNTQGQNGVYCYKTGNRSVSLACVDSQGVSGPAIKSGVTVPSGSLPTYVVTFDGNGYEGGDVPESMIVVHGVKITLPDAGTLTKTGYKFAGWGVITGGQMISLNAGEEYEVTSDITLRVKWERIEYTVQLYDSDGTTLWETKALEYDWSTIPSFPKGKIISGKSFAGWNTKVDGSGDSYYGGGADSLTTEDGGIINLYAQWVDTEIGHFVYTDQSVTTYYDKARDGGYAGLVPMTDCMGVVCNLSASKVPTLILYQKAYSESWDEASTRASNMNTEEFNSFETNQKQWKLPTKNEYQLYIRPNFNVLNEKLGEIIKSNQYYADKVQYNREYWTNVQNVYYLFKFDGTEEDKNTTDKCYSRFVRQY